MQKRISITIDPNVLTQVDNIRGLVPRSRMLAVLIQNGLSMNHNLTKECYNEKHG